MANTTVPNLPAVTALYGTEQIYVVQNGVSSRATVQQVANLYQENLIVGVTPVNNAQHGYVLYNNNGVLGSAAAGIGSVTNVTFTGGLISVQYSNTTPSFTVAGTSGGMPYFSNADTWASSGTLATNALVVGGGAGAAPHTVTTGSGVLAALSNNTGTVGSVLVNGGTLGTPQNGVMTNVTGLPLTTGVTGTLPVANGGTGITSFGTGVATALGQNVTGSGSIVLATNPTLINPLNGTNGGTGVNNGSNTISISGNVAHVGNFTQTFTATANSSITIPTSGTLISSTTALSGAVTGTPSGSTYLRGDGTWSALPATALTINTTGINSGTSGMVLYDNSGTVGELAVTGTGNVVLSASPTLIGTINGESATFTGGLSISNTAPAIELKETDAPTDSKLWYYSANGGILIGYAANDANTLGYQWLNVTRSGAIITGVIFPSGNVSISNNQFYGAKDTGGTYRHLMGISGDNWTRMSAGGPNGFDWQNQTFSAVWARLTAGGFQLPNAGQVITFPDGSTQGTAATNLGFTPVQQGGGTGQFTNKLYIGWSGSKLYFQVDAINFGATWPIDISGTASGNVPTDVGNLGIGCFTIMRSTTYVSKGGTVAGSALQPIHYTTTYNFWDTSGGDTPSGTWKNISGSPVWNTDIATFQRIA